MKKEKNNSKNFWSGYAMGMLAGSTLMFAFGTKKGRETLKKVMDHTETLEHNVEDILKLIQRTSQDAMEDEKKPE